MRLHMENIKADKISSTSSSVWIREIFGYTVLNPTTNNLNCTIFFIGRVEFHDEINITTYYVPPGQKNLNLSIRQFQDKYFNETV